MAVVTLLTDFGLKDGNVGVLKGVIWGIAPGVQIADLSHTIQPQNVAEAALVLARSAPYFPPGTVHLAVVDPGVGTARRPMAAHLGEQFYVLPDNGLITLVLERASSDGLPTRLVHLDRSQYWLPQISAVFHGRDIFAPTAAYLAKGVSLEELGSPLTDPVRLKLPHPQFTHEGLLSEVIHIDHFGNLSTNIRREHLGEPQEIRVQLRGVEVRGLVRTFGDKQAGELVALYGSTGNLIVAQVNGNAARALGAHVGDPVVVVLESAQ